jgi:hypothetical protein
MLRRSATVGAAVAAAGTGVVAFQHGHLYDEPTPACELRYLQRREYAILAALSNALFPPGNSIGLSGTDARVPEYIDRMLADMRADKAVEFKTMLLLFEHGTTAFGLRVKRFTDLDQVARERYLRRWERARVYSRRMLAAGLKTLLGIAYFAYPGVQERLGIEKTCGTAADARPREEWA